ncbi:hypothetical protein BDZ45DRAFT_753439 [Acephala macrosclerotiorum]|nr:hypothetical protein BDZ45DRAFT_753439 [Acephala macrosclerotiorum]
MSSPPLELWLYLPRVHAKSLVLFRDHYHHEIVHDHFIISATTIAVMGSYYQIQTCGKVTFNFGGSLTQPQTLPPPTLKMHPQCINSTDNTSPSSSKYE